MVIQKIKLIRTISVKISQQFLMSANRAISNLFSELFLAEFYCYWPTALPSPINGPNFELSHLNIEPPIGQNQTHNSEAHYYKVRSWKSP